jgi:hypothetical protein
MIRARILSSPAAVSLLALLWLAGFRPNASSAAQISTTYNFPSFTIDGFQSSFSHDFSVNVQQFNPALGALDSIGVSISMTVQATVTQTSGTPGDGFGAGGGAAPIFNGQSFLGFGLNVSGDTSQLNTPVTESDTEGSQTTFSLGADNIFPPDFQGAIGSGTVPVTYPYSGDVNGASTLSDVSETFSGEVTIAYNYTPASAAVPLPKSLSMSLLGLGMLVVLRVLKIAKESSASRRVA